MRFRLAYISISISPLPGSSGRESLRLDKRQRFGEPVNWPETSRNGRSRSSLRGTDTPRRYCAIPEPPAGRDVHPDTQGECRNLQKCVSSELEVAQIVGVDSESICPTGRTGFHFLRRDLRLSDTSQVLIHGIGLGGSGTADRETACMRMLVMYSTYWQRYLCSGDHRTVAEQIIRPLFPAAPPAYRS